MSSIGASDRTSGRSSYDICSAHLVRESTLIGRRTELDENSFLLTTAQQNKPHILDIFSIYYYEKKHKILVKSFQDRRYRSELHPVLVTRNPGLNDPVMMQFSG